MFNFKYYIEIAFALPIAIAKLIFLYPSINPIPLTMAAIGVFSRQFFVKSRLYLPFKMAANPYSLGHLSQVTR